MSKSGYGGECERGKKNRAKFHTSHRVRKCGRRSKRHGVVIEGFYAPRHRRSAAQGAGKPDRFTSNLQNAPPKNLSIRAKKLQPPEAIWHSEGCCSPQNKIKMPYLMSGGNYFFKKI